VGPVLIFFHLFSNFATEINNYNNENTENIPIVDDGTHLGHQHFSCTDIM
jgi:hypothetical protein